VHVLVIAQQFIQPKLSWRCCGRVS